LDLQRLWQLEYIGAIIITVIIMVAIMAVIMVEVITT
jgi:hypothetical protein